MVFASRLASAVGEAVTGLVSTRGRGKVKVGAQALKSKRTSESEAFQVYLFLVTRLASSVAHRHYSKWLTGIHLCTRGHRSSKSEYD